MCCTALMRPNQAKTVLSAVDSQASRIFLCAHVHQGGGGGGGGEGKICLVTIAWFSFRLPEFVAVQ